MDATSDHDRAVCNAAAHADAMAALESESIDFMTALFAAYVPRYVRGAEPHDPAPPRGEPAAALSRLLDA